MRAARFVTLGFLYAGVLLLAQYWLFSGFRVSVSALAQLGAGLSVLAVGVLRLWYPNEETQPEEWGLFTYGMAALDLVLTVLVLAQLLR
jgi:hypothetical protein